MLRFRKPLSETIRAFLDHQRPLDLTYREVGMTAATAAEPPVRYDHDHTRVKLGAGPEVFAAAKSALQRWEHFQLGWLETWPADMPIQPGQLVAILARKLGVWSLNACRIINVIDHIDHGVMQFGFTYGTLPGHVESGEERFLIEMDSSGTVWYDVLACSRPRHILARLGYPLVRRMQHEFAQQSALAMQRAVQPIR